MRLSRFVILIAVTGIPLWYGYRTISERRVRRLDWSVFLTDEERRQKEIADTKARNEAKAEVDRKKAEADAAGLKEENDKRARQKGRAASIQRCLSEVQEGEGEYRELVAENKRYVTFTQDVLQSPPPTSGNYRLVDEYDFTATFKHYYRERISESLLRSQFDALKHAEQKCRALASVPNETSEIPGELETIENARKFFRSTAQRLTSSRSKILNLIKYAKGELPETVAGRLLAGHVSEDIYRVMHGPVE
jgi:hypothetical protein